MKIYSNFVLVNNNYHLEYFIIMEVLEARSVISKAGLKVTPQRIAVMLSITDRRDHPTAEQIYDILKESNPGITQATVYNILDTLVEHDVITRVFTPEGKQRFEPNIANHGHIYCYKSKEIIDFHDKELDDLITGYLKKKKINNLKIKNISLFISGEKMDESKEVYIK